MSDLNVNAVNSTTTQPLSSNDEQQIRTKLSTFDSTSSVWAEYQHLDTNGNGTLEDDNLSNNDLYRLGQEFGIVPDGKFDETKQLDAENCFVLSGAKAMNQTEWGRQAIDNAVDKNHAGTADDPYVVQLVNTNGETVEFTVTKEDLAGYVDDDGKMRNFSDSGIDTNIIEAGVVKYLKSEGVSLKGGFAAGKYSLCYMLTGDEGHGLTVGDIREANKGIYEPLTQEKLQNTMLDYASNQDSYAMTCNFKKPGFFQRMFGSSSKQMANHSYAVVGVTYNSAGEIAKVRYTNPWDSNTELSMSYEKFCKNVVQLDWHNM